MPKMCFFISGSTVHMHWHRESKLQSTKSSWVKWNTAQKNDFYVMLVSWRWEGQPAYLWDKVVSLHHLVEHLMRLNGRYQVSFQHLKHHAICYASSALTFSSAISAPRSLIRRTICTTTPIPTPKKCKKKKKKKEENMQCTALSTILSLFTKSQYSEHPTEEDLPMRNAAQLQFPLPKHLLLIQT